MGKVVSWEEAARIRRLARESRQTVVFTNGCFDLLHRGHVDLLAAARAFGDLLLVGINDDNSVRRIKGRERPLMPGEDRAVVVAALASVDCVVMFPQDTPLKLILELQPDVLVKGADYAEADVVGAEEVKRAGGRVELVPLTPGRSTTELLDRLCGGGRKPPSRDGSS